MNTEPVNTNQGPYYEDEIDLRELFMVLWNGKFWIIGATFVAAVISVAVALWLPNIYRSEVLLLADEEGGGALAGLASQYGGLASLAGISLPAGGSSEKVEGIETLKSRQFITDFIDRRYILPELMASKRYKPSTQEITYDSSDYDQDSKAWVRKVRSPYQSKPSPQEAYEEFMEILNVSEDKDTGFVTVSVEHVSPLLAQRWVTWLVEDINEKMMTKATSEAQQSIDYLSEQLKNTQVAALQEVFYSLIEEQTKTIMLAKVRPEYLFQTIDPAIAPEEEAKPKRALICILGTLLGGVLSAFVILLPHYLRPKSASDL